MVVKISSTRAKAADVPAKTLTMGQYGQITQWSGDTAHKYAGCFVQRTIFGLVMLHSGDGWNKNDLDGNNWTDCRVRICDKGEKLTIVV